MSKLRVYLSGAMSDIPKNDSTVWRHYVKVQLPELSFFNPWDHWDFDMENVEEREAMNFDLWQLRRSDLVVVNFNYVKSLGTMAELAIAYDRGIPILGIATGNDPLHPWQTSMCQKLFSDVDSCIEYLREHYVEV